MNQVTIYENAQFGQIRTIGDAENPMFCLADVGRVLDIKNIRDWKAKLNSKGVVSIYIGVQTGTKKNGKPAMQDVETTFINEQNLYRLIMRSDKPQAEPFQDWVCGEVLPAIRKSGGYMVAHQDETPEQIMARALKIADETLQRTKTELNESKKENKQLKKENQWLKIDKDCLEKDVQRLQETHDRWLPKVMFVKAVETSKQSVLIGELAKIITQNGYEIGQNRLFEWMRENGYLISACNEMYNQPTQRAMQQGLFEIKKTIVHKPSGEALIKTTPKVTGKGLVYFVNRFIYEYVNSHSDDWKKGGVAKSKKGGAK